MTAHVLDAFGLAGQTALVTGCTRGIGRAIAVALAQAGADVIGVSASLQPGAEVERAVRACGRSFTGHRVDLRDRAAAEAFAAGLLDRGPCVDVLVNNAGTIRRKPAAEHDDAIWDEVLAVNLTSPFVLARALGAAMCARGRGKIIFVASVLAFQGGLNVPSYAASKGAVGQLVKALANEWAARGVNVNAIAPGYIETDNTAPLRADADRAPAILARIPAGRWGRPEDVAGAAVFLASRASDYVHGSTVVVDGGWLGR